MPLKIKLHEKRPSVEQDISEMARVGFADKLEVSIDCLTRALFERS